GTGGASPGDLTRPHDTYGSLGLRHALEEAMPRDGDGRFVRLPDPRIGQWFRLVGDAGPAADPARGLNSLDRVLALCETYLHGRPRVAASPISDKPAGG